MLTAGIRLNFESTPSKMFDFQHNQKMFHIIFQMKYFLHHICLLSPGFEITHILKVITI